MNNMNDYSVNKGALYRSKIQQCIMSGETRKLGNHFDPQVHNKSWIASGHLPDYKYNFDLSGLGFKMTKGEKLKNFKEKYEINDLIKQGQKDFFPFKEFALILEGEILVTIEYCTNCHMHAGSTRHNQAKYLYLATELKDQILQRFPNVKILLKPLVYDTLDHSITTQIIQRRLGAFEVQIKNKYEGQTKEAVLFSKLQTKKWPDFKIILAKITQFQQRFNLVLQLNLDTTDQQKIRGIVVNLKSFSGNNNQIDQSNFLDGERTMIQSRPMSGINRPESAIQKRPQSSKLRPLSGISQISQKTIKDLNNNLQNDSKTSLNSRVSRRSGGNDKSYLFQQKSDLNGKVVFNGIPQDVYVIQVPETNDYFLKEKIVVNMFEQEADEKTFFQNINLQMQFQSFLNIKLTNGQFNLNNAIIEIKQLPKFPSQKPTQILESPPNSGCYEIILDPGNYEIIVYAEGYQTKQMEIEAISGNNDLLIALQLNEILHKKTTIQQSQSNVVSQSQLDQLIKVIPNKGSMVQNKKQSISPPQKQQVKNIQIYIYDAITNEPLPKVQVSLIEDNKKTALEKGFTNNMGECLLNVVNITSGRLRIEKSGYFAIEEHYGQNRLNLKTMTDVSFPLIQKPFTSSEFYVLVSTAFTEKVLELKIISPEGQVVTQDHQTENIQIQNSLKQGGGIAKIKNANDNKGGLFRIFAEILSPEVFSSQYLKLYVINSVEARLIEVPKIFQSSHPKIWDIGIFLKNSNARDSVGVFVEINAPTNLKSLQLNSFLQDYQYFLHFLQNSKTVDLKTILGFNHKDRLEVGGDVFVSIDKIQSNLDKYGFETSKSLSHFLASAAHVNDLYSYNKLQKKILNITPNLVFSEETINRNQSDDEGEDEII